MNEAIKNRIEQVRCGEVPQGYIHHSEGIYPSSWTKQIIDKYIHFLSETTTVNNQYPILTSARTGLFLQSEYFEDQVTREENAGYNIIPYGAITYRSRSDDGRFCFNQNLIIEKGVVSCFYPVFDIFEDKANKYYFLLFLNNYMGTQIRREIVGTSQLVLSEKKLAALHIILPPFSEQQKIAEILTCCDQVISLKKHLLDEKRRQKQWLMQKLLDPDSGVRISGFENSVWKIFRLGDLGTFSKGTGISNEDCSSGEFPCIKYGDIYMTYDVCFSDAISHTEADIASNSPHIEGGCLLFTGSGEDRLEIGKCAAYMGSTSLAVGGDIIIMKPNARKVNPLFLAYTQFTDSLIRQKARVSQGYSIVHLYADDIRKLIVDIPLNLEEQESIVEILSAADREIDLLDQELSQLQQKKKSLMQLLLTGIVRVNV